MRSKYCILSLCVLLVCFACQKESSTMEFKSYEKKYTEQNDTIKFSVELHIEMPDKGCTPELRDSISLQISNALLSINTLMEPNQLLQQYIDTVYKNYQLDMHDFRAATGLTDPFILEMVGAASLVTDSLLCYDKISYVYYGGSQGQRTIHSYVFDLTNGHRILEEDIIEPDSIDQLSTLLTQAIFNMLGHDNQALVAPNNNFRICAEGLVYSYDSFELNVFDIPAVESVDLLITREALLPLLIPGTVVEHYFSHLTPSSEQAK